MLKDVLLDDIVEIVSLMHTHVKVGCGVILDDEDDDASSSLDEILAAAEACLISLHLMTSDGLAVEVFNEVYLILNGSALPVLLSNDLVHKTCSLEHRQISTIPFISLLGGTNHGHGAAPLELLTDAINVNACAGRYRNHIGIHLIPPEVQRVCLS